MKMTVGLGTSGEWLPSFHTIWGGDGTSGGGRQERELHPRPANSSPVLPQVLLHSCLAAGEVPHQV